MNKVIHGDPFRNKYAPLIPTEPWWIGSTDLGENPNGIASVIPFLDNAESVERCVSRPLFQYMAGRLDAPKPAEPWICRRDVHPKPSSDHFWLLPELVQAGLLAKLWLVYLWDPIGALGLLLTPVGCCCMVAWFSKILIPYQGMHVVIVRECASFRTWVFAATVCFWSLLSWNNWPP